MWSRCMLWTGFVVGASYSWVGAAASSSGPAGEGVNFDGRTAYAAPVEALKLNPQALTVAVWVKPGDGRHSQIFLNVGQVNTGFTLYMFDNHARMLIGHERYAYGFTEAALPQAGAWTHYASSYDGKMVRIFRNGRPASSLNLPGKIVDLAGDLYIGAADKQERPFCGQMEDVCIWRRVLSDQEIQAIASSQAVEGLERGLAARWKSDGLNANAWASASGPAAKRIQLPMPQVLINQKDEGYRGIWYMNQPSGDEYVYKYSGGMGTYCANHIPLAWYAPQARKTFFVYGGTTKDSFRRLVHMVSYYDHETGMVPRPTILLDKNTSDAHDNPAISLDDQGYVWIFSSSHGQSRPSCISRSKKPYNIDEFEVVWSGNFSYPQPHYVSGSGFLFLHTFYNPGRTICMRTSPDGVEWSDRELLSSIHEGHYQVSGPMGPRKIGTSFMYHPNGKGLNWRTNLYYMETDDFGRTWKTAGGESLKLPLETVDNPALVHEYEHEGLLVYIQDLAADPDGRPVILYTTSKGYESGPKNGPRRWTIAHWTGAAWDVHGGDIVSDNNYDLGSLYVEARDLWRIIGPTQDGPQAYNPGGEVAMWTSSDQGRHWDLVRRMTTGSEYNHSFVRRPVNAHPDFYAYWADGHGRKPSESRLYFCNQKGDVFRLPVQMTGEFERPQRMPFANSPATQVSP